MKVNFVLENTRNCYCGGNACRLFCEWCLENWLQCGKWGQLKVIPFFFFPVSLRSYIQYLFTLVKMEANSIKKISLACVTDQGSGQFMQPKSKLARGYFLQFFVCHTSDPSHWGDSFFFFFSLDQQEFHCMKSIQSETSFLYIFRFLLDFLQAGWKANDFIVLCYYKTISMHYLIIWEASIYLNTKEEINN